ncbi:hypothetical protein [Halomicrobium zhouii]|nr:hypothetical protein [Halomicrobium zhouii]
MNDRRERRFENLMDATGEGTKSGALDVAADYYLKMSGDNPAVPNGAVPDLMKQAVEKGSLTPNEIVDILYTDELPVEYSHEWSTGRGE